MSARGVPYSEVPDSPDTLFTFGWLRFASEIGPTESCARLRRIRSTPRRFGSVSRGVRWSRHPCVAELKAFLEEPKKWKSASDSVSLSLSSLSLSLPLRVTFGIHSGIQGARCLQENPGSSHEKRLVSSECETSSTKPVRPNSSFFGRLGSSGIGQTGPTISERRSMHSMSRLSRHQSTVWRCEQMLLPPEKTRPYIDLVANQKQGSEERPLGRSDAQKALPYCPTIQNMKDAHMSFV